MIALVSDTILRPDTLLKLLRSNGSPAVKLDSLAEAICAAVRDIDDSALRGVAAGETGVAFRPKALLALLGYCYARGIFGSKAIEDLMRRDQEFQRLCSEGFPGVDLIRQFRHENREAVQACLRAGLRFIAEQNAPAGVAFEVDERHLAEETTRCITAAMFIDRMELDEL